MMNRRFLYIIVSFLLLVTLVLGGCDLFTFPTALPGTSSGTSAGGVLNLYGIDPHTLDPAISGDATSHQYVLQIFSGLLKLGDNLEPVTDIASGWEVSNGGRTLTFFLKNDVKFQSGKQVTAADFKYSWERACNPSTGSTTAATYLGDIVGAQAMLSGASKILSGVKVIDDFTLEVTIDAPKSYFLSKLSYPTSFVVDRENVASGKDWWRKPNGTGPFELKQWTQGSQVILEKNSIYYGDKAQVSTVNFQLFSGNPIDLYETGKIDVTSVSLAYIDKVLDNSGSFYKELTIVPELSFFYIGFNNKKPPFDDKNVRLAFSYAVDKEKITNLVYRSMVQKADGILPPGIPGYNKDVTGLGYDVSKAKEMLKASKYGDASNLPTITVTTSGYGSYPSSTIQALAYQWQQNLGVTVTVRQLEPELFLYNSKKEKNEMFEMGWVADYPHPQDFLDILFHSDADNNIGEYSNADVDSILEAARTEQDAAKAVSLYQQAENLIVKDAACIPLSFGKNYVLVKPYVKGYAVNPLGIAMLNKVSVEPH